METQVWFSVKIVSREKVTIMSHEFWSIICLAGLTGWIVSTLFLVFRAFPERGRFLVRPAIQWGGALAVSYIIWIVGMLNA